MCCCPRFDHGLVLGPAPPMERERLQEHGVFLGRPPPSAFIAAGSRAPHVHGSLELARAVSRLRAREAAQRGGK